jgi:hypothetical protein
MAFMPPSVPARHLILSVAFVALTALPAAAQNFMEDRDYWYKPAVFPGRSDLSKHPYGADKAKGLVIWNHGYSPDKLAPEKVPPVMQYFAEAGWDSYHLQRHPIIGVSKGKSVAGATHDLTTPLILHVLEQPAVRAYSRIVLMGQSRGAFATIHVGSLKPKIHGILPLSPAAFGDAGKSREWRQNDTYIRELWEKYKDSGILVAAGFFTGDDWFETQQPNVRGPYAEKRLTELGIPNFIINQPAYYDMQGHGGGQSWEFARRFGPCLQQFFETGQKPSCSEETAATALTYGIKLPKLATDGAFTGLWQGTWHNGRFIAISIWKHSNGLYEATYMSGKGVNGDKPEHTKMPLVQQGDELVRDHNIEFRFRRDGTDRLQVVRIDRSKPSEAGPRPVYFTRAKRS